MKKRIVLLGASGSVGSQTMDVLQLHCDIFELVGVSVGKRIDKLRKILQHNKLKYACVKDYNDYLSLKDEYSETTFFFGDEGLLQLASLENIDLVFNSLQGIVGLLPTLKAIENHCDVAMANKECLVAAGDIINQFADKYKVNVIPVDSEHSAIFQTLNGYRKEDIEKIIITASGGAFKNYSREQLKNVGIKQALNHPRWKMGAKITIDSATMMNKGFEVIEAHYLFNLPYEKIDVVVHPESIVHSLTEYKDHSILAQLAVADMRIAIQYALTYPKRIVNSSDSLSLTQVGELHFEKMDFHRFPLMDLAYIVGQKGGNMPAILNGANETAVRLFLKGEISFLDIERINFETVKAAKNHFVKDVNLDVILESDKWASETASQLR